MREEVQSTGFLPCYANRECTKWGGVTSISDLRGCLGPAARRQFRNSAGRMDAETVKNIAAPFVFVVVLSVSVIVHVRPEL